MFPPNAYRTLEIFQIDVLCAVLLMFPQFSSAPLSDILPLPEKLGGRKIMSQLNLLISLTVHT